MKKAISFIITGIIISLVSVTAFAAKLPQNDDEPAEQDIQNDNSEVGFHVLPSHPENQITPGVSYFDLLLEPGMEQTITVDVVNTSNKDIRILTQAICSTTNENGLIDYCTEGVHDETLANPFCAAISADQDYVNVKAGQTSPAYFSIHTPMEEYTGTILGGLVFTKQPGKQDADDTTEVDGIALQNVYTYVIAAKLCVCEDETFPEFEEQNASVEIGPYYTNIVHEIRNTSATIAKDVALDIEIYSESKDEVVYALEEQKVELAPNSKMPYSVLWNEKEINPGRYISYVTLNMGGRIWNFEMPFEISKDEADVINNMIEVTDKADDDIPIWAVVLICLAAVLIVLLSALLYKRKKKAT